MGQGIQKKPSRLEGLDVARLFALIGMVIVNFNIVMVTHVEAADIGLDFSTLLQGRAAALFVVLAGIGFGLGFARYEWGEYVGLTLRRAAFLFVIGLLNFLIFSADIIHYYAFYFVFGIVFLRVPNWGIWLAIVGLIIGFLGLILGLNFDQGWVWETFTYEGFWTVEGFVRNLMFNGWHPIIPWLAFFLLGIRLSRLDLAQTKIQIRLLVSGVLTFAIAVGVSHVIMGVVDTDTAILFQTLPVPPVPLYMCAGAGFACAMIGVCLLVEPKLRAYKLLDIFTRPGRMTLTFYIAHIFLGMGVLERLGMLGAQTARMSLFASMVFCCVIVVFAFFWSQKFKRGPLETVMRKITD